MYEDWNIHQSWHDDRNHRQSDREPPYRQGQVRIGKNGSDTPSAETSAEDEMEEEAPTSEEPADAGDADIDACLARFTDEVVKESGIRVKPR